MLNHQMDQVSVHMKHVLAVLEFTMTELFMLLSGIFYLFFM